jgi:dihydrofolate reductase
VRVSLIYAVAENGVIGREGALPWRLKGDLRFFSQTTRGHTVVMGRVTYDSIGRPLPKRENIVVSRNPELSIEGCQVVSSLDAALDLAERAGETETFVIGGAQIYAQALPRVQAIYRTRVLAAVEGDSVMPPLNLDGWHLSELQRHEADEDNEHPFVIERLDAPESR